MAGKLVRDKHEDMAAGKLVRAKDADAAAGVHC